MNARILLYDVECTPITAHVWGLRDLSVGINQIVEDPRLLGVGHKWYGGTPARYLSDLRLGRREMLERTWSLLDKADVVVGYNSVGFDNKWMNGEFAREGMPPPSPYKNLDLYRIVRANFRWPSYKLQYASTALGLEGKLDTGGHGLWVKVMEGDAKADDKMARYCRRDVDLLEPMLDKLTPWLPASVNMALLHGIESLACQKCASTNLESRGIAYTASRSYPQYRCRDCGGWTRDTRSVGSSRTAGVVR
jgi:hypothetical protein